MSQTINQTKLDNGIRIITDKIPHVRSISLGVWVNVGARDESLKENGLSHCIEHMIFKGTKKRSAFQVAKEFDTIGGQTNAFTSMEHTCYHAKVMDSHLEPMVDILSDIFLNSVFDPNEVEKELPVILQEIVMVEENPEEHIHTLSGCNFWGEHPLGRSVLGSRENLTKFNARTIKRFFHRLYQPDRIVIAAAGNIDHEHLVDLIEPLFKKIKRQNGFPDRIQPVPHSAISLNYKELEQVHICLGTKGLSITDPRRYAFSLLNTILGGTMSSRLFQEIRENRGLAYSVYSFISSYVDTGMFGIYAGVAPSAAYKTIEVLSKEIKKIKTTPVDLTELRNAKEYTKGNILLSLENTENQMVRLAQSEIYFGRFIPVQDIVDSIESVTEEDILCLAEDIFNPSLFSLTLLGPVSDKKPFKNILAM